jgi:hypothetical protein
MNGHFAHVSSGGEKRPKDRPRSVDGVNLEFFSRSRFRKSEKISVTLPFLVKNVSHLGRASTSSAVQSSAAASAG